ncbi:MAG TPA: alpha-L-glutamate ligase [Chloroflexota bacterium]|nr:alpha-L-glutamate ligase [Chloroflexota bacterium]
MKICLIVDNPDTRRHPVIGVLLHKLSPRHGVRLLDVRGLTSADAVAQEEMRVLADVYLLKSHAIQALDVAYRLEQRGALVVNPWSATVACQDRVLMAQRVCGTDCPWPQTWNLGTVGDVLAREDVLATLPFPLIIKSRYSRREDLVLKVHNVEEVQALAPRWRQEPVLLQEFAGGDGWDIKVWVIGQQVFAARRRTPLEPPTVKEDFPLLAGDVPNEWAQVALEIGRVFGLRLYGVDLLMTARGPLIVDVNAFPGFRGVHGASSALVALVEQVAAER